MRRAMASLFFVAAFLIFTVSGLAVERLVPSEYPTIQAAIDAAEAGDTVIVAQGRYARWGNVDIDFKGKPITLRSIDPNDPNIVAVTVIDCRGIRNSRGFYFHTDEGPDSVLDGLTITNGYYESAGGAIYCDGSSPLITRCIITNNRSFNGGGIYCNNSQPIIRNCEITLNYNGGVYCKQSSLNMSGCVVIGNTGYEGVIGCENSNLNISNCVISANTGDGGIHCEESTGTISGCAITSNTGIVSGGGICCEESNFTMTGCTIKDNAAKYSCGGIFCRKSNLIINDCHIEGNTAADNGSGIWCKGGSLTIRNCKVVGNSCKGNGGGIYSFSTNIMVINCTITDNFADRGGGIWNGGVKWDTRPDIFLTNCTIARNLTTEYGGGVYNEYGNLTLSNCIIWNNRPGQIFGSVTVTYTDVESGWSGEGNINADPQFLDIGAGDYRLSVGSPCINAGDPGYKPLPGETDIDGEPRVAGSRVDMGPDEFSHEMPYIDTLPVESALFYADEGGADPEAQVLVINNGGVGTLSWEIRYDCSRLEVEPQNGTSTGEADEVKLEVDTRGLAAGTYTCELRISDPGAANNPRRINVTLYVGAEGVLYVPAQYETIQVAIDAAVDGNTITVADGVYIGAGNRDIDFKGKAITLKSLGGPENCVIDCQRQIGHRGFHFHSGEGANSVVSGFTIKNGFAHGDTNEPNAYGGAIACESDSNPTIVNCQIIANTADAGNNYCGCEPDCRPANAYGGGIYCKESSPTIIDCAITNNMAKGAKSWTGCASPDGGDAYGGAIFCSSNSYPMISNCVISNNEARGGQGADGGLSGNASAGGNAYGGGIYSDLGSNPILEDCNIVGNTISGGNGGRGHYCTASDAGDAYGAGICCGRESTVMIYNCRISNNQATGGTGGTGEVGDPGGSGGNAYGGGIYCGGTSQLTIGSCNIAGNIASGGKGGNGEGGYRTGPVGGKGGNSHGGGICCDTDSGSEIENCTIAGNKVLGGKGGIGESRSAIAGTDGYNGDAHGAGIYYDTNSVGAITNSIVWSNDGDAIYGSRPDVTYGDIEGGWPGEGNIDADPLFVRPGYWADANDPSIAVEPNDPNAVWIIGDYHLSQKAAGQAVDSPCVDAGSDTAVNLGMDQFTTRTDKVGDEGIVDMGYHHCENVADLNDDGKVNMADLAILAFQWQQEPSVPSADIAPTGGDGSVDDSDLGLFVDNWLWEAGRSGVPR